MSTIINSMEVVADIIWIGMLGTLVIVGIPCIVNKLYKEYVKKVYKNRMAVKLDRKYQQKKQF